MTAKTLEMTAKIPLTSGQTSDVVWREFLRNWGRKASKEDSLTVEENNLDTNLGYVNIEST